MGSLRSKAVATVVERKLAERGLRRLTDFVNFRGGYVFEDRRKGTDAFAMVLAGYKPELWDFSLDRLALAADEVDLDVCVVAPAVRPPALRALAEERGWSFLSTDANNVSLAQNLAIREHPHARLIHKLDEDIAIPAGYFGAMRAGYDQVAAEGLYQPGFCAPVLNVNGFSYVEFLRTLGLEDEYRARFGTIRKAAEGIPATDDGEAALWIWRHSVPFDEVAERFAAQPFAYSAVPHRFSIGAIVFERDFWERMGGLRVRPPHGFLGVDEAHIGRKAHDFSRPPVVIHNVLAGHYSFGPQSPAMFAALPELKPGIVPSRAADRALGETRA